MQAERKPVDRPIVLTLSEQEARDIRAVIEQSSKAEDAEQAKKSKHPDPDRAALTMQNLYTSLGETL